MSKITYTKINGKTLWCRFASRYRDQNDYHVGQCRPEVGQSESCRVEVMDGGTKRAPFADDAGLTLEEAFEAVAAYERERAVEFDQWLAKHQHLVAERKAGNATVNTVILIALACALCVVGTAVVVGNVAADISAVLVQSGW